MESSDLVGAAERTDSTLQFRLVLNEDADACPERYENPPAESEVRMPTLDGECYLLGPADLEMRSIDTTLESAAGIDSLGLSFRESDAKRFSEITGMNVNRRLAMVMFGRVLSAPTVSQPITDGKAAISGPSREELEALADELGS
jgi:preprotein translocase subunit SecD